MFRGDTFFNYINKKLTFLRSTKYSIKLKIYNHFDIILIIKKIKKHKLLLLFTNVYNSNYGK